MFDITGLCLLWMFMEACGERLFYGSECGNGGYTGIQEGALLDWSIYGLRDRLQGKRARSLDVQSL
ncbi:hypothetical protein ACFL6S_17700 [Candidatus Poribacteria bacterium]